MILELPSKTPNAKPYRISVTQVGQDFYNKTLGRVARRVKPRSRSIEVFVKIPWFDCGKGRIVR